MCTQYSLARNFLTKLNYEKNANKLKVKTDAFVIVQFQQLAKFIKRGTKSTSLSCDNLL